MMSHAEGNPTTVATPQIKNFTSRVGWWSEGFLGPQSVKSPTMFEDKNIDGFFVVFCLGRREFSLHGKPHKRLNFHENLSSPPWIFFWKECFYISSKVFRRRKMQILFLPLHIQPYLLDTFRANGFCRFLEKGEGWNEQTYYYIIYYLVKL